MSSTAHSSSDDSDVSALSDSFHNSKSSFRVSICLRRYFSDVRARAFVLARPARRVRWLQRRLRRLFALRGAFCLRAAGHLLPSAEPLRLLRAGERVEVIPLPEAHGENQIRQVANAHIEAKESPSEEKTTTTTSFSADITVCNGSLYNGDDHDMETNNTANTDSARLGERDTQSVAEPPSTVADVSAEDALDSAPGDTLQATVTDVSAGDEGSLLSLKRRALALLHTLDEGPPPPRRARRRVRRRRRAPTPVPAEPPPSPSAPLRSPDASPSAPLRSPDASPSAPLRTPGASPSVPLRSPDASPRAAPRDVAQNEDACVRKPRMVHSLDLDII
ncbi:histone-lysine N-methyltransferase SETD1A-like [Maniola jurtina]|uniref:histone-lysine N-methyltransferase SETD1A-like n=1 Tax=Maniola jurtina TaxID=191418 RepID=UPI001E68A448|nr:histone-lysine N-methyltransferase SETD1A-like [Maniola jurtina]